MPWKTGISRSPDERLKISRGLQKYYSKKTRFIRVRSLKAYDGLYRYEHKTKLILKGMKECNMPSANRKKIGEYVDNLSLTCRAGHIYQNARILFNELRDVKASFNGNLEETMLGKYREIQLSGLSDYTKATRVNIIKSFLRWLNNGYPPMYLVKMRTSKRRMRPDRNFTLDEVRKFLRHCGSLEEAAFYSVLWEGDFSVGELLRLRIRDVCVRDDVVELRVEGKDRNRIVPILRKKGMMFPLGSHAFLERHLKNLNGMHEDNFVWSMRRYNQVQYRVKKIREKSGLPHVRSHSFRKSRATYNIEIGLGLPETAIFGGWVVGSQCLKDYVIRSGRSMLPKLREFNKPTDKFPIGISERSYP